MKVCRACEGTGRITRDLDPEVWPNGLVCDACIGTGDHDLMRLWRAYRLGESHEHARMMAVLGVEPAPASLGAEAIRAAVADDTAWRATERATG